MALALEMEVSAQEQPLLQVQSVQKCLFLAHLSLTYGFSGVEPNTVLLGWGRQTRNPVQFAKMLKYLSDLDLNIVLLDYEPERGFGKYEQIDV